MTLLPKRFQKRVEDFVCATCGTAVSGTGYTNHCPQCLWSKHVDVNPGDRAATCGGRMEPVGVEGGAGGYVLVHRCERCGVERRNKAGAGDSAAAIIALAEKRR